MPIDYSKYPPDWEERRLRILTREDYKCKNCGVPQYAVGHRDISGMFIPLGGASILDFVGQGLDYPSGDRITFAEAKRIAETLNELPFETEKKYFVVVLTVAHLDHDEANWEVADERLAALCQKCHLEYDREEKQRRRKAKTEAQRGWLRLFN